MASLAIPLITSGISALAGLFGNKSKPIQQTNTSTTQQNFSPLQQSLMDMFSKGAIDRYQQGTDLGGYTAGGLRQINQTADLRKLATQNILGARGQSFSPSAGVADIQGENSRLSDSSNFLNSIPLLQHQMQGADLDQLIRAFSSIPGSSTTTQKGTGLVGGNPLAGTLSGLGAGLNAPYTNNDGSIVTNIAKLFGGFGGKSSSNGNYNPYDYE